MTTSAATAARTTVLTAADPIVVPSADTRTSLGVAAAIGSSTPVSRRRRGLGRLRNRVLSFLVALLAIAGVALAVPTAASASASTRNFYAECSPRSVQAIGPDMGWYPNYAVTWSPTLFIYTSAGWRPYLNGPTQAAVGINVGGSLADDWVQQEVHFNGLPRGHYYQVRNTAAWLGQGLNMPLQYNVLVPHQTAQGNFTFAAYSNSTASYCYIP